MNIVKITRMERSQDHSRGDNPHQEKFDAYMRELLAEKSQIDEAKFPHAYRLIDEGKLY